MVRESCQGTTVGGSRWSYFGSLGHDTFRGEASNLEMFGKSHWQKDFMAGCATRLLNAGSFPISLGDGDACNLYNVAACARCNNGWIEFGFFPNGQNCHGSLPPLFQTWRRSIRHRLEALASPEWLGRQTGISSQARAHG